MGFTLQPIAPARGSQNRIEWAILLDNELLMFVGTYRECEDWLDWQGVGLPKGPRAWFRPLWKKLVSKYQVFLRQEAGCTDSFDALVMGILLASVYLFAVPAALISTGGAWNWNGVPWVAAHQPCRSASSGRLAAQCDGPIEIVCDGRGQQ